MATPNEVCVCVRARVLKNKLKGQAHVCMTATDRDKGSGVAVTVINLPTVNVIGHNRTSLHATLLLLAVNLRPLCRHTV